MLTCISPDPPAFAALDEAGGTRHIELARALVQKGHQVTIISSPVSYLTGKARSGRVHWVKKNSLKTRYDPAHLHLSGSASQFFSPYRELFQFHGLLF
jgi:hypothetical protein